MVRKAGIAIKDKKRLYPLAVANRGNMLSKGFIIKTTVPIKITIQ